MTVLLKAEAEIALSHGPDHMAGVQGRLTDFASTWRCEAGDYAFDFPFGKARIAVGQDGLRLEVAAQSLAALARLKELTAHAVEMHARSEAPRIVWSGDLAGLKQPPQLRIMHVLSIADVTPRMRRIRLAGEDLARFAELDGLHVRLMFPTPQNPDPQWPTLGPSGLLVWHEERRPESRIYTTRAFDVAAGWLDIDFVLHGDDEGVGGRWAAHAAPGDLLGVIGPLGQPIRKADWYLLGCDETGLPAMSRILEALPPTARGFAFAEVQDKGEEQALSYAADIPLVWLHRDALHPGESPLLGDAVTAVDWPEGGVPFGWLAAETSVAKRVRDYWREVRGKSGRAALSASYWRLGGDSLMSDLSLRSS